MLDAQGKPVDLSRCSRQEVHWCLPLSLPTFVAAMSLGKQDPMEGLVGDWSYGAMQRRSHERLDQCDQGRGVHNGIKFFNHPRLKQCAGMGKEACSTMEPLWALVLMGTLVLGRSWGGERRMVPRQPQCLSDRVREQAKPCGMEGFGWSTRGEESVERGAHRLQPLGPHRRIARCDQAAQAGQLGAAARDRTEPPAGSPAVYGVVEQREQESKGIVACSGVRTRMMGGCIVVETRGEMGGACGVGESGRRLVLLGHGRRGCARQLAAPVKEVATRRPPITPPARVLARRMRARHEATAPIGGHAEAVEAVRAEVVTMGVPGLRRGLRGQWSCHDGRPVRLHRAHEGLMAGKHLLAQRQHHVVLGHREGRRQRSIVGGEAGTAISHRVRLVLAVLAERGETRKRAFACQTSQEDERVQQGGRVCNARLLSATKRCHWAVRRPHQLIQPGSGAVRLLSHVRHLAIEALREPREPDHGDTGVRRSIVASDTRHRTASGGWGMVMNRGDARL